MAAGNDKHNETIKLIKIITYVLIRLNYINLIKLHLSNFWNKTKANNIANSAAIFADASHGRNWRIKRRRQFEADIGLLELLLVKGLIKHIRLADAQWMMARGFRNWFKGQWTPKLNYPVNILCNTSKLHIKPLLTYLHVQPVLEQKVSLYRFIYKVFLKEDKIICQLSFN